MKKFILIMILIFLVFAFCKPKVEVPQCAKAGETCLKDADCCPDLKLKCKGKKGKKTCN